MRRTATERDFSYLCDAVHRLHRNLIFIPERHEQKKTGRLHRSRRQRRQRHRHLPRRGRPLGPVPHRGRLHAGSSGTQPSPGDRILQQAPQGAARNQPQRRPLRHSLPRGVFRRGGHHPKHRRPARTRRQQPCHPPARRTAQAAQLDRRNPLLPHRGVGTETRRPGARRLAGPPLRGLLRRSGTDVRAGSPHLRAPT